MARRGPGLSGTRPSDLARGVTAEFLTIRPSPVRWPLAAGGALSMGIPLAGFTLLGREDLGLMTSIGGFLALYLGGRSRRDRARALPLLGIGLVAASGLGAAAAPARASSAVALFVVTTVAALAVYGFSVGPPGAMFFVLACGVGVHLAAPVALGGVGRAAWLVPVMTGLGCVIAYAIVLAPLLLPRVWHQDRAAHEERRPWSFGYHPADGVVVVRVVAGTALGLLVAMPLSLSHIYWVLLTVVAILQGGVGRRITAVRGLQRVVGTIVGLAVFSVILRVDPHGLWLAVVVAALQFGTELVITRNYGLALVLVTPLALTISSQGTASREGLALERLGDTLLGAACAAAVLAGGWLARRRR